MSTKIFFYVNSIFFVLSTFLLQVNAETKIIAKGGDTLLNLSKEYGVPLKELMHKNNLIDANKNVEGEVIIIPLINSFDERLTYKVIDGDTLYKIAKDYNVNVIDIISINNLENASLLKPNQKIILPKGAIYRKVVDEKEVKSIPKKVAYHQTSKIENISKIAELHNISTEEIIVLNELKNPAKISSNTKLKIREKNVLGWKKYGSLRINWSDWRYLDGNYITEAKNKNNKLFYLSISCERRALNHTLLNSYWTNWYTPNSDFEFKLIGDFCDRVYKI